MRHHRAILLLTCAMLALGCLARPAGSQSAPTAPAETGVYTEDFSSYAKKDRTTDTSWAQSHQQLRLLRRSATEQDISASVIDSQGNTFIVWGDNRNGVVDLFMQKLDPRGNRLWPTDIRVPGDGGNLMHASLSAAIDASDRIYVAWTSHDGSYDQDAFVQKFDTNGTPLWSGDLRINAIPGTVDDLSSIAVNSEGSFFIAWNAGNVYLQRFGPQGNRLWIDDVIVTSSTLELDIDIDASNRVYLAWSQYSNDEEDIHSQSYDGNGVKRWPSDVRVNSDATTVWQRDAQIAVDNAGNSFIHWWHWASPSTSYAQILDANGNKRLSSDMEMKAGAFVSHKPTGRILFVWSADNNLFVQLYSPNGATVWPTPTRIVDTASAQTWLGFPAVSIGRNNQVAVTWSRSGQGLIGYDFEGGDLYAQRLDLNGARLWSQERFVPDDPGYIGQGNVRLLTSPDGTLLALWNDGRDRGGYAQRFSSAGVPIWPIERRLIAQTIGGAALDAQGNLFVAFTLADGNSYLQKFDVNANQLWTAPRRINSFDGAGGVDRLLAGPNGDLFVIWVRGYEIYGQRLSSVGGRLWAADLRLSSSVRPGQVYSWSWDTAAAVDHGGNLIVVWSERTENYDEFLYGQKISAQGSRLWSDDIRMSMYSTEYSDYERYPAVGVDSTNNVIVAWSGDEGEDHIYAQKLTAAGTRLWANDTVVDSSSTDLFLPSSVSLVIDSADNVVVAWSDMRNHAVNLQQSSLHRTPQAIEGALGPTRSDFFAQKLNPNGGKLWGQDVRVNGAPGVPTIYAHEVAISLGPSNSAYIGWVEYLHGNGDVYIQRVGQNGVRSWNGDVQLVAPDRFYAPVGSAQSLTVDTIGSNIATALLSADIIPNGGSVEFYLSNNGGAAWAAVEPGITHVFTTAGSDLRWRAELKADPAFAQSPAVNQLRIEYNSQLPATDLYEVDNMCAEASPIDIGGAIQRHTFHQANDHDWINFLVVANTLYTIRATGIGPDAQPSIMLATSCATPLTLPTPPGPNQEAILQWRAPSTGQVWVRVANTPATVGGPQTAYDLAVRQQDRPPLALIVAGHDDAYSLQSNIDASADLAYMTMLNGGIPRANIRYLGPTTARDVDGNGANDDIAAVATPTTVRDSIQAWARSRGFGADTPLFIYLVGHGHIDQFQVAGSANKISGWDFDLWLDNLQNNNAGRVAVIIEACRSGSFIEQSSNGPASISGPRRAIITATKETQNAFPSAGATLFSELFWTALSENIDAQAAFQVANEGVLARGLAQTPQLDDTGDMRANASDGDLARTLGLAGSLGDRRPDVRAIKVDESSGSISATLWDDYGVTEAWVEIYRPDFVEPAPTENGTLPPITVPRVTLTQDGSTFVGTYSSFDLPGWYRIVGYARDLDGHLAMPYAIRVCVQCSEIFLPMLQR